MNKIEMTMLEILKESQFGDEGFSLTNVDFDLLLKEARHQSVLGLVLPFVPKKDLPDEFIHHSDIQIANYIRYLYEEDHLKIILDDAELPFVILKGDAAAIYYKNPGQRSMGDIDFIVPSEEFEKTINILKNSGFAAVPGSENHPRHISFVKNGISFELHRRFSHNDVDIEDYIIKGLNHICIGKIEDHEFPMLPKLANGLVLLDHMRNHLKGGLGLRQAVDWMMYVYRELDDEFWEKEFSRVAKEKEMDTLAIVATRMCQIYMGLPETITWCKDADEELCEQLMENLLASGNFGRKQGSGNSVEFVSTHMKSQGTFRWLQKMGEYNWEAYRKHHWLKPFCWIYQGFRYAKKGFKTGRNRKQLSDDFNRSEQRYELLKKLGIEQ